MSKVSFDLWMHEVDTYVERYLGCSVYDLPDCLFGDWYGDGTRPATAARMAIRNAKGD